MQNININLNNRDQLDTFTDGTLHTAKFRQLHGEERLSSMPEKQIKRTKPHTAQTLLNHGSKETNHLRLLVTAGEQHETC